MCGGAFCLWFSLHVGPPPQLKIRLHVVMGYALEPDAPAPGPLAQLALQQAQGAALASWAALRVGIYKVAREAG